MDSFNLFLSTVAATIVYMVYGKFRVKEKKTIASSSSSSSPPSLQFSLPHNWIHHVFPSFHGADVRRSFLRHILKEFKSKGIDTFIDNEINRGEFIGPELKKAIQGSRIAVVLLTKNYASSSWCLDELVEIMKCKKDLGQTVIAIFYEVDPSDIKKQAGDFGKAFRKTCKGKTNEVIEKWRQALAQVATVAGYHSRNWDDEATMIENIASDISNMLNISSISRDFDGFVGMRTHMENMRPLLRLDLDDVRMIGIWGPPGIGKSTIARVLFNEHSPEFQLRAIMVNIRVSYPRPCLDEYSAQLQLQGQMMTQILNHNDTVTAHLGVARERLKDKKVFLVLDDVDRLAQLDALAKDIRWFGRGSRIIITTEDLRVLKAHGINHIYKVDFPTTDEALQIFCTYAFGQKYPKDGFEELAREVTYHAGNLPLGLKVMGSYFRRMSKQEWKKKLPRLRSRLDREIESVLKFSYDALDDEDKDLFLHIACFFNGGNVEKVEEHLSKRFLDVRQGLDILAEKSLISVEYSLIEMHSLLVKLGCDIVRKQSIDEPGQRQFLVDSGEICDVLTDDTAGSKSVIGINLDFNGGELNISERAFEKMTNLRFLRLSQSTFPHDKCLSYLSPKLQLLDWSYFPATCLPYNAHMKFLVELKMTSSKLEKLWDGNKSLQNLKRMDLSDSSKLKELHNLSSATSLEELNFDGCSSLVELPVSIGNLHKLRKLSLQGCSKLEILPVNINLESLNKLDLSDCLSLKSFPKISTNLTSLDLSRTAIEEVPSLIMSWSRLHWLTLNGCKELLSLPQLPYSLQYLDARNCESLERLDCSFHNPEIYLDFANCFRLNKEARDLIIQTPTWGTVILSDGEIPSYFTHRANGGSLIVKLNERFFPSSLIFKACILPVSKHIYTRMNIEYGIMDKHNSLKVPCSPNSITIFGHPTEHLYIFEFKADVTSNELFFEFRITSGEGVIKGCGVHNVNKKRKRMWYNGEINEGDNAERKKRKMEKKTWNNDQWRQ